jgi:hypothetical protein
LREASGGCCSKDVDTQPVKKRNLRKIPLKFGILASSICVQNNLDASLHCCTIAAFRFGLGMSINIGPMFCVHLALLDCDFQMT